MKPEGQFYSFDLEALYEESKTLAKIKDLQPKVLCKPHYGDSHLEMVV